MSADLSPGTVFLGENMLRTIFLVIALSGLTAPAFADPTPSSDGSGTQTPAASADPADKLYCVHEPAPTGSHMGGGKVCHTRAEWQTIHDASGDAMNRYFQSHDNAGLQGSMGH